MGFFGDERDPFDDIIKEFFGPQASGRRESRNSEANEEEGNANIIETKEKFFVIFELPGYSEEDLSVDVKGNKITVTARRDPSDRIEEYLVEKLSAETKISKTLPSFVKSKNYDYTFRNGVLEVSFSR